MRVSRLLATALLVPVGLVGVTACGPKEDKKSGDAAPAASAPTSAAAASGTESLTAVEIMKKAQVDNAKVSSVKVAFDLTSDAMHMTGAVAEDKSGNCVGQVTRGDKGSFEMMRSGTTVWIKPDAVFWEKTVAPGMSKTMAGKYLKGGVSDANLKGMTAFCDMGLNVLKTVGKNTDGSDGTARATKSGTKQVGSVKAVVLTDQSGADSAEIAFAAEGPVYLLELISKGSDPGSMTFTDFEKPVTVTPPPAAQVVDASKFLKG